MFQRYDSVLAVEGPYTQNTLCAMLVEYKNKPLPPVPFSIAMVLISKQSGPVHVFNDSLLLRQRFLGVYCANGMLSEQEIDLLRRSSEYQVDFSGRLSVIPSSAYEDRGVSFERRLTARGKEEVVEGDVILVEERRPDEPPCTEFTLAYSSTNNAKNLAIDLGTESGQRIRSLDWHQMHKALRELRAATCDVGGAPGEARSSN